MGVPWLGSVLRLLGLLQAPCSHIGLMERPIASLALTNLLPIKFPRSFPNQPDGSLDTFVAQALFYSSDRMSAS